MLLSLLSGLYRVHGLRVLQPLSRCSLTLLASSFFLESVVVVFSVFSPPFSPCVLSFLSLVYWPFRTRLLACLIRAVILCFSRRLYLFTVVLISVLLYQSAAIVFLDGSRNSEGLELVMESLAFHLFVGGSYFCSVLL